MKYKFILLFILALSLLVIAGCGKKECDIGADCLSKKCQDASCDDSKCVYSPKENCIGNLKCEEKAGENKCNAEIDCGKCQGEVIASETKYGKTKAKYLKYLCTEKPNAKCVVDVDPKEVKSATLTDTYKTTDFSLDLTTTFNKPFNINKDSFNVEVRLTDTSQRFMGPLKITMVQIKSGQALYGQVAQVQELSSVGSTAVFTIPTDKYSMENLEEEKTVAFKVYFEYSFSSSKGTETDRNSFDKQFSQKIFFVNGGAVK